MYRDSFTTEDSTDTNKPGPGRTLYRGVRYLGRRLEKAVSGDGALRDIGGEDRSRSIGSSQCPPTGSTPNAREIPTVNPPAWPHPQPFPTTSTTNGYPLQPSHYLNIQYPQYFGNPVAQTCTPFPPTQPVTHIPTMGFQVSVCTTTPSAPLNSNAGIPPNQCVLVPPSTVPTVIILSSVPSSGSVGRSTNRSRSPVRTSSRGRETERDPEMLRCSANHRFHAFFEILEFLESRPNIQAKRKIADLIERMRRQMKPFRVEKRHGVMHISRKLDDQLFDELNAFVDAMDLLIGDFIFEIPEFICCLTKRHRNDMFRLFDSPRNREWINEMKQLIHDSRAQRS